MKDLKILDCTLRDGGYYNKWDFDKQVYTKYLEAIEKLPIDIVEIGYRSSSKNEYFGKFFYCPEYLIKQIIELLPSKKLALMLNERECDPQQVDRLLHTIYNRVHIIRLAVDPKRLSSALVLAKKIKSLGYKVGLNLMYMSEIIKDSSILSQLSSLNGVVDYFSLVDSFGGVYPHEVRETVNKVKEILDMPLGFHGHNNIEMALVNSLAAIDSGCTIIDSTITGMGRGAGNLKTELLLAVLNAKYQLDVDFNPLSEIVDIFEDLQKKYKWGTNLPYMVSGVNSLPQKEVMDWVGKNRYSIGSIVSAIKNIKQEDVKLPVISLAKVYKKVLIIGGGKSAVDNINAINELVEKNPDNYCIVHSSTRNITYYKHINTKQYCCLVGNEGYKLELLFDNLGSNDHIYIYPPFPREMGTYIPSGISNQVYELECIDFIDKYHDSPLTLAIQIALNLKAEVISFVGFDGYGDKMNSDLFELSMENQYVFDKLHTISKNVEFITPTLYKNITQNSIFSYLV